MYEAREYEVWRAIASKFGLPFELPDIVKEIDERALYTEMLELMPYDPNQDWFPAGMRPLSTEGPLPMDHAYHIFVAAFASYCPAHSSMGSNKN